MCLLETRRRRGRSGVFGGQSRTAGDPASAFASAPPKERQIGRFGRILTRCAAPSILPRPVPTRGWGNFGPRPPPTPRRSPHVKILVVDDEEAIRDSLDLVLRFEHHEVTLAKDGQEGLESLEQVDAIELVFLDIKMPGRDGLEANMLSPWSSESASPSLIFHC